MLAHFVIRPDLDLRYHNTHHPADVCITFVIGLKGHIGLALRTARPPDLKAAALKDRTLDLKMPGHVGLLGLNGTTVLVWKLELPLNQQISAVLSVGSLLEHDLEIVACFGS
ncbi:MAG: hypothetical protein ACLQU3_21060 [Limisphaerales bacterium]